MRLAPLALLAAMPLSTFAVDFVAHRGASYDAPENTVSSVTLGYEQGADAVEIDIYLTADQQVVLFHDKNTAKIDGDKRPIAAQTLAELQRRDVGSWRGNAGKWTGNAYDGEHMPVLADVLPLIPAGRRMFVEIKAGPEILPHVKRVFEESGVAVDRLTIIAFDKDVAAGAKQLFPEIPVYWLSSIKDDPQTKQPAPALDELIATAKSLGVDGLDVQAHRVVDAKFVQTVKDAGLQIHVWTVDDPAEAQRLAAAGAASITTNRPAFLRKAVDSAN